MILDALLTGSLFAGTILYVLGVVVIGAITLAVDARERKRWTEDD